MRCSTLPDALIAAVQSARVLASRCNHCFAFGYSAIRRQQGAREGCTDKCSKKFHHSQCLADQNPEAVG